MEALSSAMNTTNPSKAPLLDQVCTVVGIQGVHAVPELTGMLKNSPSGHYSICDDHFSSKRIHSKALHEEMVRFGDVAKRPLCLYKRKSLTKFKQNPTDDTELHFDCFL